MDLLTTLELAIAGFLIGANVWFFFLQSPSLILFMGRDKFIPIQMRLTKLLFRTQSVAAILLFLLTWQFGGTVALQGAGLAAAAALIANFVVIPKALKAGGKGRVETMDEGGDKSVTKFASEGSGPSATFWHRTVVLFVVLILLGALVTLYGAVQAG